MSTLVLAAPRSTDVRASLRQAYALVHQHRDWAFRFYLLSLGLALLTGDHAGHTILAMCLAVSVATDLLWKRIFNGVVGSSIVLALTAGAVGLPGTPSFGSMLLGAGVCFGVMLALFLICRGGAGDVKLMAVVGAILGWHDGLLAVMFGYLIAALAVCGLVAGRLAGAKAWPFTMKTLPMAPFVALGVLLVLRG